MKPLKRKDLRVLASLIRETTYEKVVVCKTHLSIERNGVYTVSVMIKDGEAFANGIIPGFLMKPILTRSVWNWLILI